MQETRQEVIDFAGPGMFITPSTSIPGAVAIWGTRDVLVDSQDYFGGSSIQRKVKSYALEGRFVPEDPSMLPLPEASAAIAFDYHGDAVKIQIAVSTQGAKSVEFSSIQP